MTAVASPSPAGAEVGDKTFANLRAQFALLGHELLAIRMADGRRYFEVRRWGQARMFSTIHGVQGFLAQIGGAK